MTFPTVSTSATSNGTTSPASVTLPASIAAGDMLLVFISPTGSSTVVTVPTGWTQTGLPTDVGLNRWHWRIADGTEGASQSFTMSGNANWCAIAYRITDWAGLPESGSQGASANPPSKTPTWGARDTLWLAAFNDSVAVESPAAPANYSNLTTSSKTNVQICICERQLNAATEDPGTITGVTGTNGTAYTIAILGKPANFGELRGKFGAQATSVPNPMICSQAINVVAGDVIFVLANERNTTSTVTGVTDNLSNSYSSLVTASATSVNPQIFYSIATTGGLCKPQAACTASANDYSFEVLSFNGPYAGSPVDLNPAATTDATSPYAGPASGTPSQNDILMLGYFANSNGVSVSLPTPTGPPAAIIELVVGSGTGANTTSSCVLSLLLTAGGAQTFGFTGSASTQGVQGVVAFKKDTGGGGGGLGALLSHTRSRMVGGGLILTARPRRRRKKQRLILPPKYRSKRGDMTLS